MQTSTLSGTLKTTPERAPMAHDINRFFCKPPQQIPSSPTRGDSFMPVFLFSQGALTREFSGGALRRKRIRKVRANAMLVCWGIANATASHAIPTGHNKHLPTATGIIALTLQTQSARSSAPIGATIASIMNHRYLGIGVEESPAVAELKAKPTDGIGRSRRQLPHARGCQGERR